MTRNLFLAIIMGTSFYAMAQKAPETGKYTLFAPSNMMEFGVNAGYSWINGDVKEKPGFGLGVHLRRALDYTFSLRGNLNAQFLSGKASNNGFFRVGGEAIINGSLPDGRTFNAHKTSFISGTVDVVISLNNNRWDNGERKINPYVFAGGGVAYTNTKMDGVKGTGGPTGDGVELTLGGRKTSKVVPNLEGGFGIGFRVNPKVSVSIEEKLSTIFGKRADLLDGYEFRFRDIVSYTNIRLGFNISGGKDAKKTMPLWWANPAEQMNADIAELKARPKFDPTDSDGDGVIDMVDQEKDTPAGARVDTRGVSLDSDGDGLADFKDKEPFSPAGFKVDGQGVAQVPKPNYATEADVDRIVDAKIAKLQATMGTSPQTTKGSGMADWFLPMIHFDFNSARVNTSEFGNIAAVASVMKNNPSVNVVVSGFTDKIAGDGYNQGLSYRRAQNAIDALVSRFGIDRGRLILNYSGENNTLVPTSAASYMNRRVEFKVAQGETEMAAPANEMKKKSYKGNKNAGY